VRLGRLLGRRRRPPGARRLYAPPADAAITLARGLAVIAARWPAVRSPSTAAPIFVLAAGWRSGSTLLQRMIAASGDAVVWGEPYGHAALIDALAHPIRCVTPAWPHDDWFLAGRAPRALAEAWIANLFPSVEDLLRAHLAFFEALFAAPARAAGAGRWGVKETRLTSDHAAYLRWLFPRAHLLMLYRDPYAAYRSYRRWGSWYLSWPDRPLDSPAVFGAHWRDLVEGYRADHARLGARLLRYEDLVAGRPSVAELGAELGLAPAPAASLRRVGGHQETQAVPPLAPEDVAALRAAVDPLAADLGYAPPL